MKTVAIQNGFSELPHLPASKSCKQVLQASSNCFNQLPFPWPPPTLSSLLVHTNVVKRLKCRFCFSLCCFQKNPKPRPPCCRSLIFPLTVETCCLWSPANMFSLLSLFPLKVVFQQLTFLPWLYKQQPCFHFFSSVFSYVNEIFLFEMVPEMGILPVGPCILGIHRFVSIGKWILFSEERTLDFFVFSKAYTT